MASQAEQIRDLLVERLEILDPTLDLSPGSKTYATVVAPIFEALGVDPFDTDIEAFLKARIRQEFPSVPANDGDAIVDLLVRPLQLLLEPLKREEQLVRLGQSTLNASVMREEDADGLSANWFVPRKAGSRATGVVRVFFAAPTFVNVASTVTFSTTGGLRFFPTVPQAFNAETVLLQRSGSLYYVDVNIIAENPGSEYRVTAGEISRVTGIPSASRVSNIVAIADGGEDRETNVELLARTQRSLTERSLNTRRGVSARLQTEFPGIRNLEVVGYGDPEMNRDIVTGNGEGHVKSAGTAFIVGQFCLYFAQYEDRGLDGLAKVAAGDAIVLNYWPFLYDVPAEQRNEEFAIENVLFDSRDNITNIPAVILFQLSGSPSPASAVGGLLPGMLPAVFAVIRGKGKITISSMPGGILEPETVRGEVVINDGEIHIGGHYDVWVRPTADTSSSVDVTALRSTSIVVEATTLVTEGAGAQPNRVSAEYVVEYTDRVGTLSVGQTLTGGTSGATALIGESVAVGTTGTLTLTGPTANFKVGEGVSNGLGSTATLSTVSPSLPLAGVEAGMLLSILGGNDTGVYRVLATDDVYVFLDVDLTMSEGDIHFRVVSEVVVDAFAPKETLIPFGTTRGDNLQTFIGSATVRASVDLLQFGVGVGDSLEILEGEDKGSYTITAFDSVLGSKAPVLSADMVSTNSNLDYRVFRALDGIQTPLVRIQPGGVKLLDPSGQDSGNVVPYALPVAGYARGGFSGSRTIAKGLNGFILPDPGLTWSPTSDIVASRDEFEDTTTCFSDECLACEDGYIAVATLMANGDFYINSSMPTAVKEFFSNLQSWLRDVINTFGIQDDAKALIEGLTPVFFGVPVDALELTGITGTYAIGELVTGGTSGTTATVTALEMLLDLAAVVGTFEDGETITGGTSGATASIVVVSGTRLRLSGITGSFVAGEVLTGGTSGATATLSVVVGTVAFTGATGLFTDGETVTGGTSGAAGTIETIVVPVLQFEICLPVELFDGCNNVFIALPEFDWAALLDDVDSLDDVVDQYTTGLLDSPEPALKSAAPGDSLTLLAGSNAGSYLIDRVFQYKLGTLGAIESGVGQLDKAYSVTAVTIRAEFPVPILAGLADFFTSGIPDLTALPAPPDFPGTSYDEAGVAQTPWKWVALFFDWFFKWLNSLGFDVPAGLTLDARETIKSLWQLLFTEYTLGKPTCSADARVYFLEPTSFSAFAPMPCAKLVFALPVTSPVVLVGEEFTLPLADLAGVVGTLRVGTIGEIEVLTGALPASAGTATTISDLADILQTLLDSAEAFVVFSGPATATGALTITTAAAGVDAVVAPEAEDLADAFRWMGFFDSDGQEWAEVGSTADPVDFLATHILLDPAFPAGFGVHFDTLVPIATFDLNVDLTVGLTGPTLFDFVALEAVITARILAAITPFLTSPTVTVSFATEAYIVTITDANIVPIVPQFILQPPFPAVIIDLMLPLFGSAIPIPAIAYTAICSTPVPFVKKDLISTVVDGVNTYNLTTVSIPYADAVSLDAGILAAQALVGSTKFDLLAQGLNLLADAFGDGTRRVWFVGGTELRVRTDAGGTDVNLELDASASSGYEALGYPDPSEDDGAGVGNAVGAGVTTPGAEIVEVYEPHPPTLFAIPAGAGDFLFTASPEAAAMQVFPGQDAEGNVPVTELPRDILVSSPYTGMLSIDVQFTDTAFEAPVFVGIVKGSDFLLLYEQRDLQEFGIPSYAEDHAKDRVPALVTTAGSANVRLLQQASSFFDFLTPQSGDEEDVVQVGDLIFIEEGDDTGGYVVTARVSDTELTLDRALTTSSGFIHRFNNTGTILAGTAVLEGTVGDFVVDDVGRFVTLFGANREDYDGSYRITAVDLSDPANPTATLDTAVFPNDEIDIHWAVVRAPTEDPGDSETGGRTELVGLRPFRVYNGTPTEWRVVSVGTTLDRAAAKVTVTLGDSEAGPKKGVLQPYQFTRPGVQRLSSTAMAAQREKGFYFSDVLSLSLDNGENQNIPANTRMEPVFGTYASDGYRLEVADNRFSFSTQEELSLVLTPFFLPEGRDDRGDEMVGLESRGVRIAYDLAPLVGQLQSFMTSEQDRVLCANPLVRHFLPSYVSLDVTYTGGDASATIAEALRTFVTSLEPTDPLDVSEAENILHGHGATRYDHPVTWFSLTHDLDRRLVLMKSDNRIGEDEVDFNGTNRTTFFIPGPDHSGETEATIADGERIFLTRGVRPTTIR